MDNETSVTSEPIVAVETPMAPANSKRKRTLIILTIVALLLLLVAGILLLSNNANRGGNTGGNTPDETDNTDGEDDEGEENDDDTETPPDDGEDGDGTDTGSQLPEGWTYVTAEKCDLKMPLPPRKEPYVIMDGVGTSVEFYWQTKGGTRTQTLWPNMYFDNYADALFLPEVPQNNDYIPGWLRVYCTENTEGYTTSSFAELTKKSLADTTEVVGANAVCTPTITDIQKWGRSVKFVDGNCKVGGQDYPSDQYVFVEGNLIYLLIKRGSDTYVQAQYRDQIFDLISFE